jgi:hypothetical protein
MNTNNPTYPYLSLWDFRLRLDQNCSRALVGLARLADRRALSLREGEALDSPPGPIETLVEELVGRDVEPAHRPKNFRCFGAGQPALNFGQVAEALAARYPGTELGARELLTLIQVCDRIDAKIFPAVTTVEVPLSAGRAGLLALDVEAGKPRLAIFDPLGGCPVRPVGVGQKGVEEGGDEQKEDEQKSRERKRLYHELNHGTVVIAEPAP